MNLPKIDLPTYEFELISTGKKIKFRPFLVKEQKILLMAMESGDEKDALDSIKQIVSNCIIEKDFDINQLSSFDLEYFFVQLRMRSIGEKINLSFSCKNMISEEEECNNLMKFEYDLSKVSIEHEPNHSKTIFFTKDIGVVMKYPSFNVIKEALDLESEKSETENALNMIIDCIDYFFEGENVFYINEMSRKEIEEYIENLPKTYFDKMESFFDTFPKVKSIIEHKCKKCGFDHVIPVEGLTSFFV